MKQIINIPITVIEAVSIDLSSKDVIVINSKTDFLELCKGIYLIYKLKKSYYILADTVAWVYNGVL